MKKTRSTSASSYRARSKHYSRMREGDSLLFPYTVMSLAIILLSLPIPLAASESSLAKGVSWVACLVCAALTVFTSRKFSSVILVSLAFTFLISYIGDPITVATVFGAIISCGLYSAAVAAARKVHAFFLIATPIFTVTVALILTQSITFSLLSAAQFLPALALGLASRRPRSRSLSIALFATVGIAELGIAVISYIYTKNQSISLEIIDHAVEYLRGGIEWTLKDAIIKAGAVAISDSVILQIKEMATVTVNLLPGIVVITALTLGFFVQKIERSLFESYGKEELMASAAEPIDASCATALIFITAHVLSYTSGASHTPSFLAIASENLSLILLPVLLCIGLRILGDLPKKIGFLAIAVWIGAVLLANALSTSILTVLALVGAFYIIFVRTDSWAKDYYAKKGEDQ